jgi:uncharacterized protein YecE (DUF72 family)
MPVLIGTSGWQYADWRGRFYPKGLGQTKWLEHYGNHFETVELNNSFYRLPDEETFARWRASTPGDFVFSVKASRYLTHVRRLQDPEEPVHRLMDHARGLGPKLGPVLVQLPSNLRVDVGALEAVLRAFPRRTRVAFEPRHESWFVDDVAAVLRAHDAALCLVDAPGRKAPLWRTAGWGYLRLHEGRAAPSPCYGRRALATWAERLAGLWSSGEDVFVYFNNDRGGCAVRDAHRFARAVTSAGLLPSLVPTAQEAGTPGASGQS